MIPLVESVSSFLRIFPEKSLTDSRAGAIFAFAMVSYWDLLVTSSAAGAGRAISRVARHSDPPAAATHRRPAYGSRQGAPDYPCDSGGTYRASAKVRASSVDTLRARDPQVTATWMHRKTTWGRPYPAPVAGMRSGLARKGQENARIDDRSPRHVGIHVRRRAGPVHPGATEDSCSIHHRRHPYHGTADGADALTGPQPYAPSPRRWAGVRVF